MSTIRRTSDPPRSTSSEHIAVARRTRRGRLWRGDDLDGDERAGRRAFPARPARDHRGRRGPHSGVDARAAIAAADARARRRAGRLTAPDALVRSDDTLEPDLVLLGTWTVTYVVGPANGNGANIVIPLDRLDGRVIKPGATLDFWNAVGEVSRRTGYRRGAIIVGHRIDPDGALAGGICTVSTALFNAAARAGLPITTRTSHSGYLAKYPLGLDAAVAKGDHFRQTMAFRNDTTEPILIRTVSRPGTARVDLYGAASLGRTVEFNQPAVSHRERARDRHVTTTSLPRGQHHRVEDRSDGMSVVVTRTVRDANGHVLRRDRWVSVYRWLGGLVLDGIG